MLRGSLTALITPFRDGEVDHDALAKFVEWQISEGSDGVVPVGTTGESPTLTHEEDREIVELVVKVAAGRVPVIAGAGSNSTAEALEMTKFVEKAGADAILSVAPYYNKPNQEGLFHHFSTIASATSLPVILYNIPGRSVIDIAVETMARLREACPNIVGVKDATADVGRATRQRQVLGEDFVQLSGDDMTALGFNAHGGQGCISVCSNVAPALCAQAQAASLSGEFDKALAIQDKLAPLHSALFIEPSPAGAKYVANKLGFCANELRAPLVPVSSETAAVLDRAMEHAGLG